MLVLARKRHPWKNTRLIVQPDPWLRWHRAGFRLLWQMNSGDTARRRQPKLSAENIALIKPLARNKRRWGAERIRGEWLKLPIRVAKRTIQQDLRQAREPQPAEYKPASQTWRTFLHNQARDIGACDFLQVADLFFRALFSFFIIELNTRRVVHVRVTRSPT